MRITFSEASNLNKAVYGNVQAPIQMFLEKRGEAFEQNSVLKNLFKMGTSKNFGDMFTSMTAMEGFQPVGESGAYPNDSMQEGFEKFMKYQTWKDSFRISKEMIEDGKLMDMGQKPAQFMQGYGRTRELFGAALYGGALKGEKKINFRGMEFDLTTADGEGLFSKTHKNKVKGADQTNMYSDAFSVDALGKLETAMHLFRGDNDEILDVAPTTILIPEDADLKKSVFAAIGADKDPLTANNAFNYEYGRWNVIIWPYLNKYITASSKPWILLDEKYNDLAGGAVWNDRIQLEITSGMDDNTDDNIWRGRSRFNACFNDWRYIAAGGISGGSTLSK